MFCNVVFADDIQDFEIEGITIGKSLLDYMTEKEIKENVGFVYPDKKFTVTVYMDNGHVFQIQISINVRNVAQLKYT